MNGDWKCCPGCALVLSCELPFWLQPAVELPQWSSLNHATGADVVD